MKIGLKRKNTLLAAGTALLLIICLLIPATIGASADMVNVYKLENPELTMENIGGDNAVWKPSGHILEQRDGYYKIDTDSWAFWLSNDSLDFACIKTPFNTGRGSILTVETSVTSWSGTGSGSAGIHIRNGLADDDVGIYLCQRPGNIYFMYRKTKGVSVNQGIHLQVNDTYPTAFRIELNKTKNNATGYYKVGNGKWITIGNIPYQSTNQVYVGLAAHASTQDRFDVMECQGLTVQLDAPEGYEIEDDTSSGDTGSTEPEEPEFTLPEDLPAPGDALLRETFTDGNLFPAADQQSVTNPVWTVREGTPNVMVDEAQTNRYLLLNASDNPLMMTAGDMHWTDYSVQVDITFPSADITQYESNYFNLLFRHKTVVIGGSSDYAVSLVNKFQNNGLIGQYVQLNYGKSRNTFSPSGSNTYTTLKEVMLVEAGMVAADVTHTLRVDALDNTITVYFDGEVVLTWDDTDRAAVATDATAVLYEKNRPHLLGCVGLYATNISAQVDNLLVRKLQDPIGGDYDNQIGGGFDQPVPDYIKERYGRG